MDIKIAKYYLVVFIVIIAATNSSVCQKISTKNYCINDIEIFNSYGLSKDSSFLIGRIAISDYADTMFYLKDSIIYGVLIQKNQIVKKVDVRNEFLKIPSVKFMKLPVSFFYNEGSVVLLTYEPYWVADPKIFVIKILDNRKRIEKEVFKQSIPDPYSVFDTYYFNEKRKEYLLSDIDDVGILTFNEDTLSFTGNSFFDSFDGSIYEILKRKDKFLLYKSKSNGKRKRIFERNLTTNEIVPFVIKKEVFFKYSFDDHIEIYHVTSKKKNTLLYSSKKNDFRAYGGIKVFRHGFFWIINRSLYTVMIK